jgi:hypothetical protein
MREYEIHGRIGCWDDLRGLGIHALTGEACGWSLRLLCDVTARGKQVVERFLGGNVTIAAESNWNGGSDGEEHVGSVMLPCSILPELAAFALAFRGPHGVVITKDGDAVEYTGHWDQEFYPIRRIVRLPEKPAQLGDRNEHAMSGRVI